MPNFYIEAALTVANGNVYSDVRQVVVPPEDRVLNVSVTPNAAEYKPGEKATIQIKLTQLNGEPFKGSSVISVYDKSVEYISGGSNVPDIKDFFWKWRRTHYSYTESSGSRMGWNLQREGTISMGEIGVFGNLTSLVRRSGEELAGQAIDGLQVERAAKAMPTSNQGAIQHARCGRRGRLRWRRRRRRARQQWPPGGSQRHARRRRGRHARNARLIAHGHGRPGPDDRTDDPQRISPIPPSGSGSNVDTLKDGDRRRSPFRCRKISTDLQGEGLGPSAARRARRPGPGGCSQRTKNLERGSAGPALLCAEG